MNRQRSGKSRKLRIPLLIAYAVLAVFGFFVGIGANVTQTNGESDVKELLYKAIEKIGKDALNEKDGGVSDNSHERSSEPFRPSPEPPAILVLEDVDGGVMESRRLPKANPLGGVGKTVVVLEISETIDMGLSALVKRAIDDNKEASAFILDINTPGGRVDAATEIRDAIMGAPSTMRTVAFINPRAISAGAFISLACDLIFITDGGSIGAATPITISGGDAAPVDEKMVSYFRTEMATTARAKGRRGDIAEAMVDYDVEIENITPSGKLLTLDTLGALKYKIADAKVGSIEKVVDRLALPKAKRIVVSLNWAERIARILTHPVFSGILMSIGVLGIMVELYQPGFGLPGIVGMSCLVLFFAGHLIVHLAGWEEILLFAFGIGLLAVELYVTPGFGVAGILGILAIVVSLVLSVNTMPLSVSFENGVLLSSFGRVLVSLVCTGVLFVILMTAFVKISKKNRLVLDTAISSTSIDGAQHDALKDIMEAGTVGMTESFLRPSGIARFGDNRLDVVTEGDFIDKGNEVIILRISGNQIIVKKES